MKLSQHSKERISERTNLDKGNQKAFFRAALDKGIPPNNLKEGKLKEYLLARENQCKIKVYKGYIFIHSKNSKRLYTMYKIPDELKEMK